MSPAQVVALLLPTVLGLGPLIVGVVLGARYRRRHPRVSILLIAGCVLLGISVLLGVAVPVLMATLLADDRDISDIQLVLSGVALVNALSTAGGISLLVAAAVTGREERAPQAGGLFQYPPGPPPPR